MYVISNNIFCIYFKFCSATQARVFRVLQLQQVEPQVSVMLLMECVSVILLRLA